MKCLTLQIDLEKTLLVKKNYHISFTSALFPCAVQHRIVPRPEFFSPFTPILGPFTCFSPHCSFEDQGQRDLLHQRRHQDCARDQKQNYLQAERRDGARPEEDGAVAERRPAVCLRRDERHQRRLPGHGPEAGRQPGHHLSQALAARSAGVQEDLAQHSQAAVLGVSHHPHPPCYTPDPTDLWAAVKQPLPI